MGAGTSEDGDLRTRIAERDIGDGVAGIDVDGFESIGEHIEVAADRFFRGKLFDWSAIITRPSDAASFIDGSIRCSSWLTGHFYIVNVHQYKKHQAKKKNSPEKIKMFIFGHNFGIKKLLGIIAITK